MREVAIVTDSTSDITPEIARNLDIAVVPLSLAFGDEVFEDGILTQQEFFTRMNAAPQLPTTSQPSVGAFAEVYRRQLEHAKNIVSVHISSALSGTIESATEAARAFGERVRVFDTRNLAWGEALQVLEGARAAARGGSIGDVIAALESARQRVRMIVGIDKLDNLSRGGRIGKVSALFGGMLNLKVLFTVNATGSFEPVAKIRGASAALDHTMTWVAEQMGEHHRGVFAVMHALSPEKVVWLEEHIRARFDVQEIYLVEAGPVISTHTGTGWGVALLPVD
ncbi:MAG: DegV family protein [Actinobacteria bacterium]|nr:MAG: DegV family protein [Actinomycetota bacterium]